MIRPILEAQAETQKYFCSFFGWNEDMSKSHSEIIWPLLALQIFGPQVTTPPPQIFIPLDIQAMPFWIIEEIVDNYTKGWHLNPRIAP